MAEEDRETMLRMQRRRLGVADVQPLARPTAPLSRAGGATSQRSWGAADFPSMVGGVPCSDMNSTVTVSTATHDKEALPQYTSGYAQVLGWPEGKAAGGTLLQTAGGGIMPLPPGSVVNEPPTAMELLMARLITLSDPVLWLTVAAGVFGGMQPGERWTALVPVAVYAALQYLASHAGSSSLQLVLRSTGKLNGGR